MTSVKIERGLLTMGLYITTVLGFMAVLLIGVAMFIHYLRVGLDSSSSVRIDPKPTEKFE